MGFVALENDRDICKSISIEITACECLAAHIDYTTQQMSVNESQNLSVGNPTEGSIYTWSLSGGGSLSTTTGNSTTYTAPAANVNCLQNATITLQCDNPEVVCDTLRIAVNATAPGIAYYTNMKVEFSGGCAFMEGGWWYDQENQWLCNGTFYDHNIHSPDYVNPYGAPCPAVYDRRSATQKTAGCCPAALL